MIQPKVLVVDDERGIREALSMILEDDGYVVVSAKDGEDALQKVKELKIDLVILDVWLPKMKGTEVLKKILAIKGSLPVLMISGHADIETSVALLKNGAIDFIEKPLIKEKILVTVRNALRLRIFEEENNQLKEENKNIREILNKIYDVKGNSKEIEELRKKISRAAMTDFNILIQSASDTDRELVAYMVHLQSCKSGKPFVHVNCADISNLGKLAQASEGTLFLHNIDHLDLTAQTKILQGLQTFRVIASANEDLKEKVLEKTFREDLYYRLKEITIILPSQLSS